MIHYTDGKGYKAISSQAAWCFWARQPRAKHNPVGAYFTTYSPETKDLAAKLFVPRRKLAFLFEFEDHRDLLALPGGRGRLRRIFYSPVDYEVEPVRQGNNGETDL